jgi:ABC-type Fe3+-siderophore transport system permease subunit
MIIVILTTLTVCGAALYVILDRPVARDVGRNVLVSRRLLAVSAVALLAGLAYAVGGWLAS